MRPVWAVLICEDRHCESNARFSRLMLKRLKTSISLVITLMLCIMHRMFNSWWLIHLSCNSLLCYVSDMGTMFLKAPYRRPASDNELQITCSNPTVSRSFIQFLQLRLDYESLHVWFSSTRCIISCVSGCQSVRSLGMFVIRWSLQTHKSGYCCIQYLRIQSLLHRKKHHKILVKAT